MTNTQIVQTLYEAFGRGDVPAFLGYLRDDVAWDAEAPEIGVPWLMPRRGHAAIPGFFESLSAIEIRRFEPKLLLERDRVVVAIITLEFVVEATGRTVREDDEVHIWRFDEHGKVASFCHKVDTYRHWRALQPAD